MTLAAPWVTLLGMDRDFRKGYLEIDFPVQPFDSPVRLIGRSVTAFLANLPFLAAITLLVYLPGKFAVQFALDAFEISKLAGGFLEAIFDMLLQALLLPAVIYGLIGKLRTGKAAPLGESLRWGRRQWRKSLWNGFKMGITILLWGALFVIPGLLAMARLFLTDAVVAIEADRESDPLARSTELTKGHHSRILLVIVPLIVLDFAGYWLVLRPLRGAGHSPGMLALVDSLMTVINQLGTVAGLLIYLGSAGSGPIPERPFGQATRRS